MRGARGMIAAACLCAACGGGGPDLERMIEQPRYEPYEAGPRFPDDRVLQHPPSGTVPRDPSAAGAAGVSTREAVGAAGDGIPIPITQEVLEEGRRNWGIHCAACHGAGGYGGSIVALNMQPPLPTPLVTGHGAEHTPREYFDVITDGAERMPSYASELSARERWAVVAYMTRVLQQPHPLTPAERADSARAQVIRRRYPEDRGHSGGGHGHAGSAQSDTAAAASDGGHHQDDGHDHEH